MSISNGILIVAMFLNIGGVSTIAQGVRQSVSWPASLLWGSLGGALIGGSFAILMWSVASKDHIAPKTESTVPEERENK